MHSIPGREISPFFLSSLYTQSEFFLVSCTALALGPLQSVSGVRLYMLYAVKACIHPQLGVGPRARQFETRVCRRWQKHFPALRVQPTLTFGFETRNSARMRVASMSWRPQARPLVVAGHVAGTTSNRLEAMKRLLHGRAGVASEAFKQSLPRSGPHLRESRHAAPARLPPTSIGVVAHEADALARSTLAHIVHICPSHPV